MARQGATPVAGGATPVAGGGTPAAGPLASPTALGAFTRIQDLSHVHSPTFPMFPGAQQMTINVLVTVEADGFYKNELVLDEHTGTHMDAPAHFVADGLSADALPPQRLVAPLAVIDIAARAAGDPDAQLTPDDLLAWEGAHGPLPAGAFVAMHSGWAARVADAAAFLNQDAAGTPHFPGIHPEAAALLTGERDVVGVGVDTISLDFGPSADFASHLTLLGAGIYGLESLAALDGVPPSGATIVVGGPKHAGASGGPTRAFALY
ncbi:MAG: cyclase family protein [Chloroflexota bacterium]|nr:cyclase family protein [Chloroflexota bacterium]